MINKSIDPFKKDNKYFNTLADSNGKISNLLKYGTKSHIKYLQKNKFQRNHHKDSKYKDQFGKKRSKQKGFLFQNALISHILKKQDALYSNAKSQKNNKKILTIETIDANYQIQKERIVKYSVMNDHQQSIKANFYLNKMRKMHKKSLFNTKIVNSNRYIGFSQYKNKQICQEQYQKIVIDKLDKYSTILKKFSIRSNYSYQKQHSLKCNSFFTKRRNSVNLNPPTSIQKQKHNDQLNLTKNNQQLSYPQSFMTICHINQQPRQTSKNILKRRCLTINSQRSIINFMQI